MMGCRHTVDGELLSKFFVTRRNSDLTEGRGGEVDNELFTDALEASRRTRGIDVQGSNGSVAVREFRRCGEVGCPIIVTITETIYYGENTWVRGQIKNNPSKYPRFGPDGWRKDYSPLKDDPQYKEYMRLRAIYGDM